MPDDIRQPALQPLNDAWWDDVPAWEPPPDDTPILAPYGDVRPGYEIGMSAAAPQAAENFGDEGDERYEVCLWNIWHKGDDPAESDDLKRKINDMQLALGLLDDDVRFVRIQITCFQRCFLTFPRNIDLLLRGIADGRPDLDAGISCEPPWAADMRPLLRYRRSGNLGRESKSARLHHLQGVSPLEDTWQQRIRAYQTCLVWWVASGDMSLLKAQPGMDAEVAERVYRLLGPPTTLKSLYVQKFAATLGFWGIPSPVDFGERFGTRTVVTEPLADAIRRELGDREDDVGELIAGIDDHGSCHHAFFRHVDHVLAHTGAGGPVELPGAGDERKRITSAITNYVHAIGSWLAGRSRDDADEAWEAGANITQRVYDTLGESTPVKRWLAACLWMKLGENQAHHGRGALDTDPERFELPAEAFGV